MLQNRRLSLAIGGVLLTVLWLLGLGCTQVSLLREDSMGIPEFYNVTWIPWLVLGLAAKMFLIAGPVLVYGTAASVALRSSGRKHVVCPSPSRRE